jgi:hypothetical protein
MLLSIATKAGTAVRDSMKQALAVQKGKLILKTNQEVTELNQRVQLEASKAQKSDKKITENELTIIQKGVQQLVYRGYGTFHEQEAMDMYERQCGWEIRERNSVMVKWPFIRSEDVRQHQDNTNTTTSSSENPIIQGSQQTVVPLTSAIKSQITKHERPPNISRKRLHPSNIHPTIEESLSTHVDTIDEKPIINDTADAVQIQPAQRPFFCLYGSVDGIRDELWYDEEYRRSKGEATIIDHDEDDEWKLRQVVIECKHRMKKIHTRVATASTPPPLYDQIQAIVYCLMYETTEADIIEVFRSNTADESNDTNNNNNCNKAKDNNTTYDSKPADQSKSHRIDIATSRITLYDPINRHGEHWKSVILPRLRDFVEAVYTIRSDDGKRYQLLSSLASMEEDMSWKLIIDECPWLKDCDTAYYRLQLTKT